MNYFSILFILIFSISTFGAAFVVNSNADTSDLTAVDGLCLDLNGNCTLRAAVEQANSLASDDVITFAPNVGLIILSLNTEIVISKNGTLQIIGNGANSLVINGAGFRIFNSQGANFTITDIILTGGNASAGGAIYADNRPSNTGTVNINRVHFLANNGGTGGAFVFIGGTHSVANSTFSENTASINCGGIQTAVSGTLTIVNSTFSNNLGGTLGGALCLADTITTMRNVTITNNTAAAGGGGIFLLNSTLNFGNTIVAKNTVTGGSYPEIENIANVLTSNGNNLVGDVAGEAADTNRPITYQPTDILDTPPLLGALQNNGGATPTHALLNGSPAIDKGNNALAVDPSNSLPLTFDQRGTGFPRTTDGDGDQTATVDIGAYEKPFSTTAASATISGRVTGGSGNRGVFGAVVTLITTSGETRTATTNPFGYYSFNVQAGESYTLSVRSKRFNFTAQTVFVSENLSGIDFTAQ